MSPRETESWVMHRTGGSSRCSFAGSRRPCGLPVSLSASALLSLAVGHLSARSSGAFSLRLPCTAALRGGCGLAEGHRRGVSHNSADARVRIQMQGPAAGGSVDAGRIKVVVISGPTAVGKSALAESIASSLPGGAELISADSVQVYRGMDIGSAKPTPEEQAAVAYHLLDIAEPTDEYNAADFATDAHDAAKQIAARGALPIVVGGTGFYLQWLVFGRPGAPPATAEASARAEATIESYAGDWAAAKGAAQEMDPVYCETVLKDNDWFRLRRVFEVHYTCGQPLSSFERPQGKGLSLQQVAGALKSAPFDFRCVFLHRSRLDIFRDIDRRCELMLAQGLIQECAALVRADRLRLGPSEGLGAEDERVAERAIGYRQVLDLLWKWKETLRSAPDTMTPVWKDTTVEAFIREFQSASRQFVKRQLSWFRSDPIFKWIHAEDGEAAKQLVLRLVDMDEEGFHQLYTDPDDAQQQQEARASESSKTEQNALKRYQTQLITYSTPDRRALLAEVITKAVLSFD